MEANGIIIKNNNNNKEEEEEEYQYRECLKNHAASLGTHATDGCGEFLPSPATDPANPATLTCAACGCHRNFHRKCSTTTPLDDNIDDDNNKKKKRDHTETAHHLREDEAEAGSHVLLTLKTGGGGEGGGGPAKRFRSKFSKGQKEGMLELAESIGWRIKRREEEVVDQGCTKIGVDRGVFKVWMHNNKQAAKRNQNSKNMVLINGDHHNHDHDQHHHHDTN